MEAGPEKRSGVAPETRGLVRFLEVLMVIMVVGLIVAFAIIDV